MTDTPTPPPGKTKRNTLILLAALFGFGVALGVATLMPLHTEVGIALVYPAVATIAGVSITLIFRLFVSRPKA